MQKREMATKTICRICGKPGQGLCYDCAIDSIEWHNERLPVLQRTRAELELNERFEERK